MPLTFDDKIYKQLLEDDWLPVDRYMGKHNITFKELFKRADVPYKRTYHAYRRARDVGRARVVREDWAALQQVIWGDGE